MAAAQLLNSAETCVDEMLQGFCAAHPGLSLDLDKRVVSVRGQKSGNVAIVSGGGSGHEPFAAGYVGRGMLSAAVAGSVFASPPSSHIQSAIKSVATPAGVLVIIPNYTGDCLNFGLAIEKTRSTGVLVEGVVVGEDCALDTLQCSTGRRGMCGLLFVFKICGCLSEQGMPLYEIAESARRVVASMATIGIGLRACRLPGQPEMLFHVEEGHMELGLGVHGEAGLTALKVCSASETVHLLVERLQARLSLTVDDHVVVLINNLGSLSQLEQWVVAAEAESQLTSLGVRVLRLYVGHLMTSLDTVGFQVSVLKLPESEQFNWLKCLDSTTDAPAWPGSTHSSSHLPRQQHHVPNDTSPGSQEKSSQVRQPTTMDTTQKCLQNAAKALIGCEERLNQLDSGCGDGDCGSTLRRLAEAVLSNLSDFAGLSRSKLLQKLAEMSERAMGGTSGAIYSLLFTTAAVSGDKGGDWATMWREGLEGVMRYSQARLGDRTMLDALIPACEEYAGQPLSTPAEQVSALGRAVSTAHAGCEATKRMRARAGRASYVHTSHVTDVDAGAFGVCVWLDAIYRELLQTIT